MARETGSVLVVDDDEDTATLLGEGLRGRGYDTSVVHSAAAALDHLKLVPADVVVTDVQMPGMSGIELCAQLRERHPDTVPIVLTGFGTLEAAINAIRAGAYDFVTKPVQLDALVISINRAREHLRLRHEVTRLRTSTEGSVSIPGLLGTSPAIKEAVGVIRRVASSDATVLITGESGTGKELVARALHDLSPRRFEPFVAINCAAMPAELLESELFGHLQGAFTDAKRTRSGLFTQAGAGTILLDEIGEMPQSMQAKLLRVLQERRVRPVGSDDELAFEARVLCSTNRDLEIEVEENRFREDLYYRINVVNIPIPALRSRRSDILAIAKSFVARAAARNRRSITGISMDASRKLVDYDWPGNVRELENAIERSVALSTGPEIAVSDLPTRIQEFRSTRLEVSADLSDQFLTLEEMERRYLRHVLDAVDDNKTRAAKVLGIDRRSIYRRLKATPTDSEDADQ